MLYAWLFVAVPAAVSVVADLVLAPSPRGQAGALLARALCGAADVLDAPDGKARVRFEAVRREVVLGMPALLKLAAIEGTLARGDTDAFRSVADATMRLLAAIDVLNRHPDAAAREALAAALAPTLRAMAEILAAGGYPVAIADPCWPTTVPDDLVSIVLTISEALTGFATTPPPRVEAAPRSSGFLAADAFTSPAHVQHALKVTLAAMTCYFLFALWDWPGILPR